MLNIVLYQPEIPANTGNIIRLCANTGSQLHLIHPLGFDLADRKLRRAGLDYHEYASVRQYGTLDEYLHRRGRDRLFAVSTKGATHYCAVDYRSGDAFLFGPETRGLPATVRDGFAAAQCLYLPMSAGNRSINLSNAVAVVVFEAWRQLGFSGSGRDGCFRARFCRSR